MSVRIITYDLKNGTREDYQEFYDYIDQYSNVKLSESCYAIATDKKIEVICAELSHFIHKDKDDCVLVLIVSRGYSGNHTSEVHSWLENNLTQW